MKKAWVVSVIMGFGHLRAAFVLKDLAFKNIIIEGSKEFSSPEEYKRWKNIENLYYFMSNAYKIPIFGKPLFNLLHLLENIPSFYPRRELSKPSLAVKYLSFMIKKHELSKSLISTVCTENIPVINTYYSTAIAIDKKCPNVKDNYLIICDSDINRVWVGEHPEISRIKYLVPCLKTKDRLILYGVPDENIFITGFPLPKDNIGEKLSLLKYDLLKRLKRLDPNNKFFGLMENIVINFLNDNKNSMLMKDVSLSEENSEIPYIMVAVGGSGVYSETVKLILKSLKNKLIQNQVKLCISIGINKRVYKEINNYIRNLGLKNLIDHNIEIIYDEDIFSYFETFNKALRSTDVLWTKPSELSFYCGLGIPILIMRPVGAQEEFNSEWLKEIHAGIEQPGPIEYADEWLFDLIDSGKLADIAWNGFLKARKLGTYNIESIIQKGVMSEEELVLER